MSISFSEEIGLLIVGVVLLLLVIPGVTDVISDISGKRVHSIRRKSTKYAFAIGGISLILLSLFFMLKPDKFKSADFENTNTGDSISVGGDVNDSTIIQAGGDVNLAPTNSAFDETLDGVQIEGNDNNILVAFNKRGFPIWRKQFDTKITVATVDDIDNNGEPEVIVGFDASGSKTGFINIFDGMGDLLWELDIWKPSIYYGGAKDDARIIDLEIVDLTSDGTKEIVVISDDIYWYASKLSVVEFKNNNLDIINEYWNPGLLYTLDIMDLDKDGISEILVTGVNNDLQAILNLGGNVHIVFMLEGNDITGQAPPWFGSSKKGSEWWYGYVMPRDTRVATVFFEDIDKDGVIDIHLALSDACSYYVNKQGKRIGYGQGSACQNNSTLTMVQNP